MNLKDIAKHQFFAALFGYGPMSSKYKEPFDTSETLSAYSELWEKSVYHSLHEDLINSLNPCNAIR